MNIITRTILVLLVTGVVGNGDWMKYCQPYQGMFTPMLCGSVPTCGGQCSAYGGPPGGGNSSCGFCSDCWCPLTWCTNEPYPQPQITLNKLAGPCTLKSRLSGYTIEYWCDCAHTWYVTGTGTFTCYCLDP